MQTQVFLERISDFRPKKPCFFVRKRSIKVAVPKKAVSPQPTNRNQMPGIFNFSIKKTYKRKEGEKKFCSL
jgi:hypothetical protein